MGGPNVKAAAYLAGCIGRSAGVLAALALSGSRLLWQKRALLTVTSLTTALIAMRQPIAAGISRWRTAVKPMLPTRLALILVALLFCALAASAYGIVLVAGQQILRAQAENSSTEWMRSLTASGMDLRDVFAGKPPTPAALAEIDRLENFGGILKLAVIDPAGHVRFESRVGGASLGYLLKVDPETNENAPGAKFARARQGKVDFREQRFDGPSGTFYFVQVTVPVENGHDVIGIVDFDMDMTPGYHSLWRILTNAAISFGLILAVAFGLPGIGYWLRTREQKKAERQLNFLSNHDALTELANRGAAMRHLETLMATHSTDAPRVGVLCMDLDHFKEINDTLGHAAGDLLLKDVADRLRSALRPGELAARTAGDEFIIIREGVAGREGAEVLAERLLASFAQPFVYGEQSLRIGPSIGIALSPDDGATPELLVKKADLALHAVKSSERGRFKFYEAAMDLHSQRRRNVSERVREACENNGFQLNFQPIYSLATGLLAGFESLIRLPQADGSMVSPAEFIPIAEELGLITRIGAWVLDTACEQAAQWPHDLTVAVNISPAEFREGKVVERVAAALAKSGLKPERLEIEVTEGVLLADTDTTRKTMDGLKALGVAIVLDDFGTGYSSLSYLWQFRFDKIKIDQSFVRAIGTNGNVTDIIRTIVALGRALDVRVTAEGVETEAQAAVLRAMRCDLVQGYLYGAPVAQPEVPAFVSRPLPHSLAAGAASRQRTIDERAVTRRVADRLG